MNGTQRITCDWLKQSGLTDTELLLEALLRRGFLAYRDEQGVWLGTGSHPEDIDVLQRIAGLAVDPLYGHKDRMARVRFNHAGTSQMEAALQIVGLPQNRGFIAWAHMPYSPSGGEWGDYRAMVWGSKVATCPTRLLHKQPLGYIALDIGVALLVKALPLARVATHAWSCDGHGRSPATIRFRSRWDTLWGDAVFNALKADTHSSNWTWTRDRDLQVTPKSEFSNSEVMEMLNDIQTFARRLLQQGTIDKIGKARKRTLIALGESPPDAKRFTQEAQGQLAEEFTHFPQSQQVLFGLPVQFGKDNLLPA